MNRRIRTRRWLVLGVVSLLGGLNQLPAQSEGEQPARRAAENVFGSLGLPLDELLGKAAEPVDHLTDAARFKVPGEVKVLVLSSGVDAGAFGDAYKDHLVLQGDTDGIGLGTYAASVLFQHAPKAKLSSINVYDGKRPNRDRLIQALEAARDHAAEIDGIALAFPPAEILDPTASGMTSGRWAEYSDAGEGASGRLRGLSEGWAKLRSILGELKEKGLTVVAPAGDLGPAPQSILGVAGLPEVVTVGAAYGGSVAPTSSSGPSLFGGVKPDVVVPVGLPGLIPEKSALAEVLSGAAPVERAELDLPYPTTGGKTARLGSTIPAAVTVAAALAQLRLDQISDPASVRGVLNAAAEPQAGVPVWRQGAGVLRQAPSADLARRPMVGGPLDLGAEPTPDRDWSAAVPVIGGRLAGTPTVSLPWRIETTPTGGRAAVDVADAETHPAPTVTGGGGPVGDIVRLALPPGDNPWAPGAWCGFVKVPLAGGLEGVSGLIEDLPVCLTEGLGLNALNAYIHDVPAENLTFALIPALPPGASILTGPLMILPVDPLHTPVLAGVSGADGMVHFGNVPPAFYLMRQFSDYGAPVAEQYEGSDKVRGRDFGEHTYLGFDALVLPNPCAERIEDHRETGTDCHKSWLEAKFGPVGYDPSTARYEVNTPAGSTGVVFDFTKKVAGVSVSSRYVDLLAHPDLEHRSAISLAETLGPLPDRLGLSLKDAWSFNDAGVMGDPEGTLYAYRGLDLGTDPASVAGVSTYPFALSTPNYQGGMSLNFRYDIDDALLGVLVQVGDQPPQGALITPHGKIDLPHVDPNKPVSTSLLEAALTGVAAGSVQPADEPPGPPKQLDPARLFGAATGQVGLNFDLHPRDADSGTLTFVTVPLEPARPAAIHVGDRSFEAFTWQRVDWPRAHLMRNGGMVHGHAFTFDSNYRPEQMNHPACRRPTEGETTAEVCENWQVFVHSPLDDSETFDLIDTRSGQGFIRDARAGGAGFFNPHRGVHGDRSAFMVGGIALPLGTGVVTNGRFWEQLVVPAPVLAAHPDAVEVHIEDNQVGQSSGLLPHADGPVPLAPYVPYKSWHRFVEAGLLDDIGVK